eukprot:gene9319-6556_t
MPFQRSRDSQTLLPAPKKMVDAGVQTDPVRILPLYIGKSIKKKERERHVGGYNMHVLCIIIIIILNLFSFVRPLCLLSSAEERNSKCLYAYLALEGSAVGDVVMPRGPSQRRAAAAALPEKEEQGGRAALRVSRPSHLLQDVLLDHGAAADVLDQLVEAHDGLLFEMVTRPWSVHPSSPSAGTRSAAQASSRARKKAEGEEVDIGAASAAHPSSYLPSVVRIVVQLVCLRSRLRQGWKRIPVALQQPGRREEENQKDVVGIAQCLQELHGMSEHFQGFTDIPAALRDWAAAALSTAVQRAPALPQTLAPAPVEGETVRVARKRRPPSHGGESHSRAAKRKKLEEDDQPQQEQRSVAELLVSLHVVVRTVCRLLGYIALVFLLYAAAAASPLTAAYRFSVPQNRGWGVDQQRRAGVPSNEGVAAVQDPFLVSRGGAGPEVVELEKKKKEEEEEGEGGRGRGRGRGHPSSQDVTVLAFVSQHTLVPRQERLPASASTKASHPSAASGGGRKAPQKERARAEVWDEATSLSSMSNGGDQDLSPAPFTPPPANRQGGTPSHRPRKGGALGLALTLAGERQPRGLSNATSMDFDGPDDRAAEAEVVYAKGVEFVRHTLSPPLGYPFGSGEQEQKAGPLATEGAGEHVSQRGRLRATRDLFRTPELVEMATHRGGTPIPPPAQQKKEDPVKARQYTLRKEAKRFEPFGGFGRGFGSVSRTCQVST